MENTVRKWQEMQEELLEPPSIEDIAKRIVKNVLISEDNYEAQYIVEEELNNLLENEKKNV